MDRWVSTKNEEHRGKVSGRDEKDFPERERKREKRRKEEGGGSQVLGFNQCSQPQRQISEKDGVIKGQALLLF